MANTCSYIVMAVPDPSVRELPIPELVENRRRSIAMLPSGAPALNRDEALEEFADRVGCGPVRRRHPRRIVNQGR
jgi:hypothetical protein